MQADKPTFAVVVTEKGGVERREVYQAAELSVGRVQGNDLTLPKGNVSKRHARLIFRDGRFIITDLNSTNGTYVNRRRITQATIVREGDRIYVGDFVLRIEPATEEDTGAMRDGRGREPSQQAAAGQPPRPKVSLRSGSGRQDALGAGALSAEPSSSPSLVVAEGSSAATLQPRSEASGEVDAPAAAPMSLQYDEGFEARFRTGGWEAVERDSVVDEERTLSAAQRAVRTLIERVHESLAPGALDKDVDERLAARFLTILQEQFEDLIQDGELPAEVSAERVLADARAELLQLGPLTRLLADPRVLEIKVLRFDRIHAVFDEHVERSESAFTSNLALVRAIGRICQKSGTPLRSDEEYVRRLLPDGVEAYAVIGEAAPAGAALALRRIRVPRQTLPELVEANVASAVMARLLESVLKAGLRVLIVGKPSAGTAGVLSAVSRAGAVDGVVAVQSVDDWVLGHPSATKLDANQDAMAFSELLAFARVLAPRVIVDLRDPEHAADVVFACDSRPLTAYLPDANLHSALARLVPLVASRRPGMAQSAAAALVVASFDLVVEVVRSSDGKSRVTRIAEVVGTNAEQVTVGDLFVYEPNATVGSVEPGQFRAAAGIPNVIDALIRRGFDHQEAKSFCD